MMMQEKSTAFRCPDKMRQYLDKEQEKRGCPNNSEVLRQIIEEHMQNDPTWVGNRQADLNPNNQHHYEVGEVGSMQTMMRDGLPYEQYSKQPSKINAKGSAMKSYVDAESPGRLDPDPAVIDRYDFRTWPRKDLIKAMEIVLRNDTEINHQMQNLRTELDYTREQLNRFAAGANYRPPSAFDRFTDMWFEKWLEKHFGCM